jgi:hypothetical protein
MAHTPPSSIDEDSLANNIDEDENVNVLIDFVSSSFSTNENDRELTELIENQNKRIGSLETQLEKLSRRCTDQENTIDILRNNIRRLRFSTSDSFQNNQSARSDRVFMDSARRKFLNQWDGNMSYLTQSDPVHLAFLAHILGLPNLDSVKDD